jgi:hypothetical protein
VSLEEREAKARSRVDAERAKLVGLGAETVVNPVANVLGEWAGLYHRALPLALPIWLELAAPVVLAYGFAPGRKLPEPAPRKPKRRKAKRGPRKPAGPSAKAARAAPRLRLVANDN